MVNVSPVTTARTFLATEIKIKANEIKANWSQHNEANRFHIPWRCLCRWHVQVQTFMSVENMHQSPNQNKTKQKNHLFTVLVFVPALQHLQPFGAPFHLRVFLLKEMRSDTLITSPVTASLQLCWSGGNHSHSQSSPTHKRGPTCRWLHFTFEGGLHLNVFMFYS